MLEWIMFEHGKIVIYYNISLGSVGFFYLFKEMNAFIQQGHIQVIKSEDVYNV